MKILKSIATVIGFAALLFCASLLLALITRPIVLHGGATPQEAAQALPGDDFSKNPDFQNTLAVTIQAPPEQIWPWLVQLGQERAGFYSFEFLEDLFPCEINNTSQIRAEWQQRQVDEYVSVCQGVGGWWIYAVDPHHALVFRGKPDSNWSMALVIQPVDAQSSRLITRMRYATPPSLAMRLVEYQVVQPAHSLMQRGVLLGIRSLAEGRGLPHHTWEGLVWWSAFAGFLLAGLWLLYRRRGWQFIGEFLAAELYLSTLLWLRLPAWAGFGLNLVAFALLYLLASRSRARQPGRQNSLAGKQPVLEI